MRPIRWLGDDDCHLHEAVGGKAATLSRFASVHQVPPGFAVAALPAAIASLPDHLQAEIQRAYNVLSERRGGNDVPVAVRSSAIDEDGAAASFAGQHDTYLNVRGALAVVDAVHRCVRSAISGEALAYRSQRGIALEDVLIAVLVQELVPSDVSAVVFSANPLNGERDEVMINANWGLGESIVGGSSTPDTFIVSKAQFQVSWRDISHKERMTVLCDNGTAETDVPLDMRSRPSLDDDQILRMARLALSLEEAAGYPVDLECAIADDVLYLLQCRPITTLG
ncbi:MAG: PEP/pyruvate-binding domain-containing protein [Dehalococcoidia bacterium]